VSTAAVTDSDDPTPRRTNRWRGVVAVGLVAAAVGLVADESVLVLLAVPALVFAAYPRLTAPPDPSGALTIDRRLDDDTPAPGDPVEVTVTVRNAGESTLFDCRVVDGVPAALSVVDGTPRGAAFLRPGAEATVEYTVEATDGTHDFDPATVVVRDASGAWEVETAVGTETTVDCALDETTDPARDLTVREAGHVVSERGGAGVEFHRTRDYRRGDPTSRIDWNRYARDGDLTTVEYREEQATSVVLVVDATASAYRAAGDDDADDPHAVVRSVTAARQLFRTLSSRRNRVGVATLGRAVAWLPPGAGPDHLTRANELFATHPAFSATTPPNGSTEESVDDQVDRLRTLLPDATQVVLLSPLCAEAVVRAATTLESHGHPVTVLSPDATDDDSVGERLAGVERRNRLHRLRRVGVDVVDWSPAEPLGPTLAAAGGRGG
jgi:uncharacterized repeat protein (TIGR01451 family)